MHRPPNTTDRTWAVCRLVGRRRYVCSKPPSPRLASSPVGMCMHGKGFSLCIISFLSLLDRFCTNLLCLLFSGFIHLSLSHVDSPPLYLYDCQLGREIMDGHWGAFYRELRSFRGLLNSLAFGGMFGRTEGGSALAGWNGGEQNSSCPRGRSGVIVVQGRVSITLSHRIDYLSFHTRPGRRPGLLHNIRVAAYARRPSPSPHRTRTPHKLLGIFDS
ncbi:hypothetical protein DFH27DRAFT_372620 [Peziza echinospora]|nr:hypothetical protein DFH27DRAFT_372620 [Peziza echinospora]